MLDTTFGSYKNGTVITSIGIDVDVVNALVIQPDGKIVVAGKSYNTGSASLDFVVARYTSAGVLDETFGTGGKVTTPIGNANDEIYSIALQPDGKIVVAGKSYNGFYNDFALARYTSAGVLDYTFGTNANGKVITPIGVASEVNALALQPDGNIIVGGYSYDGVDHNFALARYTSAGVLDGAFGSNGTVITVIGNSEDMINALALQPDGKIVVAGYSIDAFNYDFALARYITDINPLTQSASLFADGRGGLVR